MNIFQGSCAYIYGNTAFLEIPEKLGPSTDIFFKKPFVSFNYLLLLINYLIVT